MTASQVISALGVVLPVLGVGYVGWRASKSTEKTGIAADYTALSARLALVEGRLDQKDTELGVVRGRLSTAIHLIRRLLEHDEVLPDEVPRWVMEE